MLGNISALASDKNIIFIISSKITHFSGRMQAVPSCWYVISNPSSCSGSVISSEWKRRIIGPDA